VKFLSGGERNRVLLAKLFSKPANVIVLDEPTNDLDTESLELLEDRLVEFEGTVLLVSHDREFLNNVVTSTIVFEPEGVREYVGGYDDWLHQRTPPEPAADKSAAKKKAAKARSSSPEPAEAVADQPRKLSFNEKRELKKLPKQIESLEAELAKVHEKMGDPEFYQSAGETIAQETERLKQLDEKLASVYKRWEELESLTP
jgi:ATP-binding cassette subfamily F protein uup